MKIFKFIPHKHWWRETGHNGLTFTTCEKTCILCGDSIHLPWNAFLKENPVWLEGKFPWNNK